MKKDLRLVVIVVVVMTALVVLCGLADSWAKGEPDTSWADAQGKYLSR